MPDANSRAYPLAPQDLETKLLTLTQAATRVGLLKKGANEATKALNKGRADLVVLAADAEPLEIILHLPLVCEDKSTPYVFVNSKTALGRACGVTRAVVACAILSSDRSPIDKEVQAARNAVEQIPL